jgi:hypothetical protein
MADGVPWAPKTSKKLPLLSGPLHARLGLRRPRPLHHPLRSRARTRPASAGGYERVSAWGKCVSVLAFLNCLILQGIHPRVCGGAKR